jgi:hypothetical protein
MIRFTSQYDALGRKVLEIRQDGTATSNNIQTGHSGASTTVSKTPVRFGDVNGMWIPVSLDAIATGEHAEIVPV